MQEHRKSHLSTLAVVLTGLALAGGSGTASAQELFFGPALEGAWHNPEYPGQGLLVDSSSGSDFFFGGWFTYPAITEGAPGEHRWWTIEGPYQDGQSELIIYSTTGGDFLDPFPATSAPAGTARVAFTDCHTLVLEYDFDHGEHGSVTLERLLPVPDGFCDSQIAYRELETVIDADTPVIFRDVSLVTMSDGAPLVSPGRSSVLISNGVIQEIGDTGAFSVPPNAVVIDGRDRFLMPGLVDSHTHLAVNVIELQGSATPQTLQLVSTNQLQLYLANGVTTILNLGDFGEPQNQWAREIESGTRIGPSLITAKYARGNTSSCDGGPSQVVVGDTFEAGQAYVQEAFAEGYRLIKIYNCTPPQAVDGILAEAAALNISVAGHLPNQYATESLLLDPTFSLVAHSNAFLWNGYLHLSSSPGARGQAVTTMINGATALSTTLWIAEKIAQVWCHNQPGIDALLAESPIEYMHSTELDLHERSVTSDRFAPPGCTPGAFHNDLMFARDMVRRVQSAGGNLLAGTDSPTVLGAAGFSMHSELQALSRAGLTHREVLATATSNAGRYLEAVLPEAVPIGRIEVGFQADLLLLDRPPDAAISAFDASLEMVMARGTLYPQAVREAWFKRIRQEYNITCPPYCQP